MLTTDATVDESQYGRQLGSFWFERQWVIIKWKDLYSLSFSLADIEEGSGGCNTPPFGRIYFTKKRSSFLDPVVDKSMYERLQLKSPPTHTHFQKFLDLHQSF